MLANVSRSSASARNCRALVPKGLKPADLFACHGTAEAVPYTRHVPIELEWAV